MANSTEPFCAVCDRANALCRTLQAKVDTLQDEVVSLRQHVRNLENQLAIARKDSSNSSKPPSSDLVKPNPQHNEDSPPRSIGGQPGHPLHERQPFPAEQITDHHVHSLEVCPTCAGPLHVNGTFGKVAQQIDLLKPPLRIEQHTCPEFWCDHCRRGYHAPMPIHIERGGLAGPQLTALVAFMKGVCHASFSTVRLFLRDVVGVTISRSHLSNILDHVTQALNGPYEELLRLLPDEKSLNVDETRHKDNGELWWTWCFRAELDTFYRIDPRRSADVLMEVLGQEFQGVLGCDYFSAYRRYMRECDVTIQFCLAHLIRDVKFLMTLPDERDRLYGTQLRAELKTMFEVIHDRDTMSAEDFQRRLESARDAVLRVGLSAPPTRHGQNLANRFRKHGSSYVTFVTTPGVEATNNLAEQAIRFVVIDRVVTQGTRSEKGRAFCERIWSVIATCAQQSRSVYGYLVAAMGAWFVGGAVPTLLG